MNNGSHPTLTTERLLLRAFRPEDAEALTALVSDRRIAADTLAIPHPYDRALADQWIASHPAAWARRETATFACIERASGRLVGCVGLSIKSEHRRAEIGYWTGVEYWGRGYCTEAADAVMRWAFDTLDLHRIVAHHMTRNPASGRVMQKLGMRHEGTLRGHMLKWGVQEDVELYGVLRGEYEGARVAEGHGSRVAGRGSDG